VEVFLIKLDNYSNEINWKEVSQLSMCLLKRTCINI
jgi:hypothetical protein